MHPLDLAIVVVLPAHDHCCGLSPRPPRARFPRLLSGRRSLTWWVIGLSIIGTNVSANGYVGRSGGAYKVGIAQANFEWIGAIPAMILASLVFIPSTGAPACTRFPSTWACATTSRSRARRRSSPASFAVFAIGVSLWAIALTLQTYLGWPIWVGIVVTGTVVGLLQHLRRSRRRGVHRRAAGDHHVSRRRGHRRHGHQRRGGCGVQPHPDRENPNHLHAYLPADHETFPGPA